eukprot:1161991-Pelagomonas_calceolata.AAC.5
MHMPAAPLFDERRDIVCGKKEVGTYDIPDDGETEGDGGEASSSFLPFQLLDCAPLLAKPFDLVMSWSVFAFGCYDMSVCMAVSAEGLVVADLFVNTWLPACCFRSHEIMKRGNEKEGIFSDHTAQP